MGLFDKLKSMDAGSFTLSLMKTTPSKRNLKGRRRIRNSFWNSDIFMK